MSPDGYGAQPAHEPIALVGVGCNFPGGATSPRAFWDLLAGGLDATRPVPDDRWEVRKFYDPDAAKSGKMSTFRGGYLDRIDQFDAHFFGIARREAMWLDPQQRLLLQATWEALEDGGLVADQLRGSDTGVFIGGFTLDYQLLQNTGIYSRYHLATHSATGMMMTMLANRLSHAFDFRGPSLTVDTACSGSLVAIHLAAQSIWNGECSLAIAGGANVMIAPTMTIAESKGGFLSPDGRCKAFDAAANGYARGEGAGVVVLKELARARADGDPVYALIRGTAVTQDGHTNGITVPSQAAQESVIRAAYGRAGIAPHQVQYVEAHGTGTPVGDPIEARAIGAVLSQGRGPRERCVIGSVKTNIGHLEAAAGVAGLTKVALALQHRQIPAHLHLRRPNPEIDFDGLALRVATELEDWPATEGPRLAGINSFGFGGTNAHVVLQEAPPEPAPVPRAAEGETVYLLPLSARSPQSLAALARSYCEYLATTTSQLHDIAYSAGVRRSHHEHRMTIAARSKSEAIAALEAFLDDRDARCVSTGRVPAAGRGKVVFVCSGMGPQWWAMGRELIRREPIFRAAIERCDAELHRYTGTSLLAALLASELDSRMAETEVAQPANFAIQVALAELLVSWGVHPDAVVGHSTGEVAAQYLSGALSFTDAVKVTYYRSSLQQRTSGSGRMLAVGMTRETLEKAVRDVGPRISVAAINSPSAVTLSGDGEVLAEMAAQLETFGVFHRFLPVTVPYHSHLMDPLRPELLAGLADLSPRRARIPLYSTVTGTRIDGIGVGAQYWWQNVRGTVLFEAAFTQLIADGYTTFVELAPHPVLAGSMRELLAAEHADGVVVAAQRRGEPDDLMARAALGTLYAHGHPVAWEQFYDAESRFVPLPGYPWDLKSYWTESEEAREDRHYTPVHPLLGQRMHAIHPTWEQEIGTGHLGYLADHRIQGSAVLPAAAYVEIALAAALAVYGSGEYAVEDLRFRAALLFSDAADVRLRTVLDQDRATVEIASYTPSADGPARWTLHATAQLRARQAGGRVPGPDAPDHAIGTRIGRAEFYDRTRAMGFEYGPAFRAVQSIDTSSGRAVATVQIPDELTGETDGYLFHPGLLDAAFQVLITAAAEPSGTGTPYLPVGIDRVQVHGRAVAHMQVSAEVVSADERLIVSNIAVHDHDGALLVEIEGFRAQSLAASTSMTPDRIDKGLYELAWHPQPLPGDAPEPADAERTWLIFTDAGGVGAAVADQLSRDGGRAITVTYGDVPEVVEDAGHFVIDPADPEHYRRLCELLADRGPISQVVHLWSLDSTFTASAPASALAPEQQRGVLSIMHLVRSLSQAGWLRPPRLRLVTRRAQAVGAEPGPVAVEQAPVWGLGRVIGHQEFTGLWGGLIDLDHGPAPAQAVLLTEEIVRGGAEDQVAYRNGERHVARLVVSDRLTPPLPPSMRPDGSYLVTGGLGALGLLVARFLVDRGARRLVLMGRSAIPDRSSWHQLAPDHPQRGLIDALLELEGRGAALHLAAVDVADADQLADWLDRYRREAWPPIRGVVHAAGIVADDLLLRMSAEEFIRVLRPKVTGSWLLHRLLRDDPLDFFVLFSSTGSVIASPGQGSYAAGNAFLDALAHHRRSLGLPAVSIGWGPWSAGMVTDLNLEQFYARRGIALIAPATGMAIFGRVLGQRLAHLIAITADWATARETSPMATLPPMFSRLSDEPDAAARPDADAAGSLLASLQDASAAARTGILTTHLHAMAARVLHLDPAEFDPQESLTALGMDSMMAIEFKQRIEAAVRVDVSVLQLLQGTSPAALGEHIAVALGGDPATTASTPAEVPADAGMPAREIEQLIAATSDQDLEVLLAELERAGADRRGPGRPAVEESS